MAADEIKSTGQCLDIAVIANLHSINSVYADIPRSVRNESGYPVGIDVRDHQDRTGAPDGAGGFPEL